MGRRKTWVRAIAILFLGFGCASNKPSSVFHPSAYLIDQAKTTGCGDAICASIITTEAIARSVFTNEKVDQTKIKFVCIADENEVESLTSICPSFRYKYQSVKSKNPIEGVIQGSSSSVTVSDPWTEYDFEISSMDGTARQKLTAVKGGQIVRLQFKK